MRYEIRARADEIQLLYRQSFPAVVASLVTGLLVCILLWPVQRHAILVGWFGALLLSTSARVVVFLRYWIMQPEGTTLLKWERPYRLTLLASAAIWGL
ncbi:MAG TPA: hypothetical protein ENK50_09310, partial [Sedimenticola sp.]|nr:hypothetical protein [Sedimenticola sp.]